MNFKLLKYNIGAAISLTLALWGVEQSPVLKQEIQEVKTSVVQVVEKVIPEEYRKGFQQIALEQ